MLTGLLPHTFKCKRVLGFRLKGLGLRFTVGLAKERDNRTPKYVLGFRLKGLGLGFRHLRLAWARILLECGLRALWLYVGLGFGV